MPIDQSNIAVLLNSIQGRMHRFAMNAMKRQYYQQHKEPNAVIKQPVLNTQDETTHAKLRPNALQHELPECSRLLQWRNLHIREMM